MDQWGQREEALFDATLKRAVEERLAYLEQACAGDFALRRRVEARLQAHQQSHQETESPSISGGVAQPEATSKLGLSLTEQVGDRIGHYKLLQKIGEGGFGVVYMAEQEEPVRRRVALKIIKLGMDTKEVIARFEAERQALAMMDHANIAKVLDAGATETGRPYFVMELVRGIKITDYCDQNALSTGQRLELFIAVCGAVQHAHQKGIIHRDIKPSNILVTASEALPVPKVIDFGIAKATQGRLTDQTIVTAFEQFIGTPAYMSPEQAMMTSLDIDTRSDIYSLGVLLYELLTGKTPFDKAELLAVGLEGMRRLIRDKEPQRPSTKLSSLAAEEQTTTAKRRQTDPPRLIRLLRGDLDWIVMKCLEKDRTRRYETANGLAMDLERHLQNEPVVACPPSRLYLFQKLVQRNKLAFGAAGAVTAALVIGLGLSTWLFFKEREARRVAVAAQDSAERARASEALQRQQAQADQAKARTEAAKSQQVSKFLKDMLQGVGPSVALGRDTKMLREILDETAKRVGKELTNQPEVEVDLRLALAGVYNELGLYKQMEEMARTALDTARANLGQQRSLVADALLELGYASMYLSNLGQAERLSREALAIRQELFGDENENVAGALSLLGLILNSQGKLAEAETIDRQALAMRRKLLGAENEFVGLSLNNLAAVLWGLGKFAEAETDYREALVIHRKHLGNEHPDVAALLSNLSLLLRDQGKLDQAETTQREALALQRKLLSAEHPALAQALNNLALVLRDQGKLEEAEAAQREALNILRKQFGEEHSDVANALNNLANVLLGQGKLDEAEPMIRQALAVRRKLLGNEHSDVAVSLSTLSNLLYKQGRLDEAETLLREDLVVVTKLVGDESLDVATVLNNLGTILQAQGKLDQAETVLRDALARLRKVSAREAADSPELGSVLYQLADVLRERKSLDQARRFAEEAIALYQGHPDWRPRNRDMAVQVFGAVLADLGDLAAAEAFYREELTKLRQRLATDDPRIAGALSLLTRVMLAQKKFAQAEPVARENLSLRDKRSPEEWRTFEARSMLGGSLLGQNKLKEAEPLLLAGGEGLKRQTEKISSDRKSRLKSLKDAVERLVQLYEATSRLEQAADWKNKLAELN